jgi:hypothetical protein
MPRKDRIKEQIQDFFDGRRYWTVRKAGGGYAFHHLEDGRPLARLKPHPSAGFQIQSWSHRGRWKTYPGKNWLVVLPLDQALEFVFNNPVGLW